MAKRGRSPGFTMTSHHIHKIQSAKIIKNLERIALGTTEAKASEQVAAANVLLRKVIPDLQSVEQQSNQNITLRTIVTGVKRDGDE